MKKAIFIAAHLTVLLFTACSTNSSNDISGGSNNDSISGNLRDSGTFVDSRDKQVYKWVTIGKQIWMAQNLNFQTQYSWCYENSSDSCAKYGRLYTWASAMDLDNSCNTKTCSSALVYPLKGVCPIGWHVPQYSEWQVLSEYVGKDSAGIILSSVTGWSDYQKCSSCEWMKIRGKNSYGFNALPAGIYENSQQQNHFWGAGEYAFFRSSSESNHSDSGSVTPFIMIWDETSLDNDQEKKRAVSLRCVKD